VPRVGRAFEAHAIIGHGHDYVAITPLHAPDAGCAEQEIGVFRSSTRTKHWQRECRSASGCFPALRPHR
jgi:hypothetical protein